MAVDLRIDDGGAPLSGQELVDNAAEELADLSARITAGLVPAGGAKHDFLEKQSATDQDDAWIAPRKVLASDATNNNGVANTMQDVTGLSFPVVTGGRYWFRFFVVYTSAATTTGARFSVNGPTLGADGIDFNAQWTLTTTTKQFNEGLQAYDTPAAAGLTSIVASNIAIVEGIVHAGANGNVIARFASEVAGSAIVAKANKSFVEYRRLD